MEKLGNTSESSTKVETHFSYIKAIAVEKGVLDIQQTIQNLVNHSFTVDERLFSIVFEEVRREEIFKKYSIEPNGAIKDLIVALKSGSFVEVAKLARENETEYEKPNEESYYVDSFEAYTQVLNKFGLVISKHYLQQLA